MAAHDDERIVEQLADLLALYDEALRDGVPPAPSTLLSPHDAGAKAEWGDPVSAAGAVVVPARLERAQACLRRLRSKWPGPGSLPAAQAALSFDPCSPGMRLGRFEIIRLLGRGGHGIVYMARDSALRRTVALKVARPETVLDPDLHGRLRREAEAAAGLDHPNLVPVYELGQSGPWVYIVSAYCPGPSLAAWLKDRKEPVPAALAAELVAALADAVAYMHSRGILHRDIKPGNVLLVSGEWVSGEWSEGPRGDSLPLTTHHSPLTPKLTDFGLAKLTDSGLHETQTGAILGTPAYMSPEQAAGQTRELGPACDMYALGVLLFEILTGRPPFEGEHAADVLRKVIREEPVSPRRLCRAVPRELATICLHCLDKQPKKRYAGARELAEDLRRFLRGEPIQARPVSAGTRTARWARRHVRMLVFVGLAILTLLGSLRLLQWQADLEEQRAAQQRVKEQQELQRWRLRYASQMNLAERAWQAADFASLASILDGLRPGPGQVDRRGFEWHYLRRQYQEDGLLLPGHQGITRVAYAPDGRTVATYGDDGSMRLWDPATGQLRVRVSAHAGPVRALVFAPDGRRLVTAGNDNTIRLWDKAGGQLLASWKGHSGPVPCVAFSPDGKTLASGGDDSRVILWNVATGHPYAHCTGHRDQVHAVLFTANGKTVVSGSADATIRLWDSVTGQPLRVLSATATRLALSPDGRWLASGGPIGVARLWDTQAWQVCGTISDTGEGANALTFSPDGKTLAFGAFQASGPPLLNLWDVSALIQTNPQPARPSSLSPLSPASGGEGAVRASISPLPPASGGGGGVRGARPSATFQWPGHNHSVVFAPDGRTLAVAGDEGSVKLWHLPHRPTDPAPPAISHAPEEAWCVAFSPDGKTLVSGGDTARGNAPLRLSDPVTGKMLWSSRGHRSLVSCVTFSPDGKWIASGSYDNTVQLAQAADGKVSLTLHGHTAPVRYLGFSPDGALLASAGRDRKVILWDLGTGERLRTLTGHRDEIRGVAFLEDGRRLASAALDKTVRIWDVATGTAVSTIEDAFGIDSLALSPDGKLLTWGKEDGRTEILELSTGQRRLLSGTHKGQVRAVAFSPDGRTLATAGADRLIRLWDPATGFNLLTLRGHLRDLHALAFSPRGDVLASASHDGAILLWSAGTPGEPAGRR